MSKRVGEFVVVALVVVGLMLSFGFTKKVKDGRDISHYSINTNVLTVGLTQVAVPREGEVITIKAANGNAGFVYVGESGVTPDKGFELDAGESVTINSYFAASTIYLIGSAANQKVSYIILN